MRTSEDVLEEASKTYEKPLEGKTAANAGIVEAEGYMH